VGAGTPAIAERTRVLDGDAAKEILRAGAEDGADLIVMSTRGRSGLACLWPGSVAMNVVRETALPVLLVHEQRARHLEPP
jgi:nucleotide-binding universal stress UspA family protein